VAEVAVHDNQRLQKGQLLFRIDPEPYQIAIEQAEAKRGSDRRLAVLDDRLASAPHLGPRPPVPLRTRARILEMSELLTQHATYFDTGAAA
jgi:multidrug efflux pump subunit AcrA (membrane-fusion protein)